MTEPTAGKNILVIEDEPDLFEALYETLYARGFGVSVSPDGEDGLRRALREKPDIILLDIIVPIMNGRMVLNRLRENEWGKDVPVILLTNQDDERNFPLADRAKANRYMVKSESSLNEIVQAIIEELKIPSKTQPLKAPPARTIEENIKVYETPDRLARASKETPSVGSFEKKSIIQEGMVAESRREFQSKSIGTESEQSPEEEVVIFEGRSESFSPQLSVDSDESDVGDSLVDKHNSSPKIESESERVFHPVFKTGEASPPEGLRTKAEELLAKTTETLSSKTDFTDPSESDPYKESTKE